MLPLPRTGLHRPQTLDEALDLLAEAGSAALPLGGGTDVLPQMKRRRWQPRALVSLRRVAELQRLETTEDGGLWLGSGLTLDRIANDTRITHDYPALAQAAAAVAAPQHRRMGTLGGNVCLPTRCIWVDQPPFWREALGGCLRTDVERARQQGLEDPESASAEPLRPSPGRCRVVPMGVRCVAAFSADTPIALVALGAMAHLAHRDGRRTLPLQDLYVPDGTRHVALNPGELVEAVGLPPVLPGEGSAYEKLRRRKAIDFPLLSVAAHVRLDERGDVASLRVVVGALGSQPRIVSLRSAELPAPPPTVAEAVAEDAFRQCKPLTNLGVDDTAWRRQMVRVLVRRAVERAASVAGPASAAQTP